MPREILQATRINPNRDSYQRLGRYPRAEGDRQHTGIARRLQVASDRPEVIAVRWRTLQEIFARLLHIVQCQLRAIVDQHIRLFRKGVGRLERHQFLQIPSIPFTIHKILASSKYFNIHSP
jgi:hypothetical protein